MRKLARGQIWQHKETWLLLTIERVGTYMGVPTCNIMMDKDDSYHGEAWLVWQKSLKGRYVYIGEL